MIRLSINLQLFVAICIAFVVSQTQEAAKVNQAHLVCSNKRVALTTVSQLEDVLKSVEANEAKCPETIREPLNSLVKLIRNESKKSLCSQEKADEILAFYRDNDMRHIHKDLKKLYLAYGLQVSSTCRKSMVSELMEVVHSGRILNEQELQEVNSWTGDNSPIASFLSEPSDYEDLVIPKYMIKLMKASDTAFGGGSGSGSGGGEGDKRMTMFMQTATDGIFASIKSTCARKLKPVYDELIAPLVTLSSVGFNYKGKTVDRNDTVNREVFQWYRIVFLCETVSNVEILEKPDEANKGKIRVFTMEEAGDLFAGNGAMDGADSQQQVNFKRVGPDADPSLGDQLLDLNDKALLKAIKKHKEPSDRLSSRLNLKMVKFVVKTLKSKTFSVLGRLTSPIRRFSWRKKKHGKADEEPIERDAMEEIKQVGEEQIQGGGEKTKKPKKNEKVEANAAKGTMDNENVLKFFEELKGQIEKKSLAKNKSDRMIWRPLRTIINVTLVSVFLLAVFVVVFTVISFFAHAAHLAAAPFVALAHAPHAIAAGLGKAGAAISGAFGHAGAAAGHAAGTVGGALGNAAGAVGGAAGHAAGAVGGAAGNAAGAVGGALGHAAGAVGGAAGNAAGAVGGAAGHAAGAVGGALGHAAGAIGGGAGHAAGAVGGAAGHAAGAVGGAAGHAAGAVGGAASHAAGAVGGIIPHG